MNRKMLKKIAMPLAMVTLFSLLGFMNVPNAMAVTPWISITPTYGVVGDPVTVNGAINTTDGDFTVRWNQASSFTGVAVGNDVTIAFDVPPTTVTPNPSGSNVAVELIDEALDAVVATVNFTLFAPEFDMYVETLPQPRQLQEGNKTSIKITVTGGLPNTRYPANITVKNPANQTHSAIVLLSNTTGTGSGNGTTAYPTDFGGAHTNLTGTYFVSSNVTGDVAEFSVGLTDKTEYRRNENVQVQAAGYKPSEVAKVNIKIEESSVVGFPKNFTASSSGLITLSWKLPVNATPGIYRITFANTTLDGTIKTPSDAQDFEVLGVVCLVQARNLADESTEGALIEVYNASAATVNKGNTNSTGWIRFNLDEGNYTLKAFVKNVQVGLLVNEVMTADTELHMQLSLANFLATVRTEEGDAVPLVDVALRLNYTTRDNTTVTETAAAQTNATGMAVIGNLFTYRTYRLEATRYGLLFSNTTVAVESSPALGWTSLNLTLPNHTLSVHAVDSKGRDAVGVSIKVYEWASGVTIPVESTETSSSGDALFSLPFGRYILRAFKGGDLLSETIVDLDEALVFTFDIVTLNLDVSVSVLDYFGQPLANAEVKIERKIGQDFVLISTQFTGSTGSAQFAEMVGGDSRVSVYLGGKLVAVKTQFLGTGSNDVIFKVAEYVAVLGYPISTGAFTLIAFILALIVVMLAAARRRIMQVFRKRSKQ